MKTFLDFIDKQNKTQQNDRIFFESFSSNDISRAIELIVRNLNKHLDRPLSALPAYEYTVVGGDNCYTKYLIDAEARMVVGLNFLRSDNASGSMHIYSIDFFRSLDVLFKGNAKTALSIYTLGSSVVYFLPIIWTVLNSGNFNITQDEAISVGRSIYESENASYPYYVGALKYDVYENLSQDTIKETFRMVTEAVETQTPAVKAYSQRKREEALAARHQGVGGTKEEKRLSKELQKEYEEIRAAIKGGAKTLEKLKLAMKHNVKVYNELNALSEEQEQKLEEKKANALSPKEAFEMMNEYIDSVVNGTFPSLIVCGAPGIGKTWKVQNRLRKIHGMKEGKDMCTINSKSSARELYMFLFQYREEGQIIIIDDCDALIKPKSADADSLNILKAALDSNPTDEGRLVSYGIANGIYNDDGEEVPKRFFYKGSIIALTNWSAGALDTALRSRCLCQDLAFSVQQTLDYIRELMPKIGIDSNGKKIVSSMAKQKAYDYLVELSKDKIKSQQMEISIRTFLTCAKLFQAVDNEEMCMRMIEEQMRNQSATEKRKH